jgi:heme exporter protein D
MMIDLGPHAVFIVWAYAGVALAVAGLIAYVIADRRKVESRIRALEAQGIRRRSTEVK